eukprot:15085957-Alexandrium_andersonii.AAC.1
MSASLVGSEMCIRDRIQVAVALGAAASAMPGRPLIGCRMPANEGSRGAVSYTHLTLPTICSV